MDAQLQAVSPLVNAVGLREPLGPGPERVTGEQGRFLFIDVAALRAKQLRAGALPRIDRAEGLEPHTLEWVAMEEVRRGLVRYELPEEERASTEGKG